MEPLDPHAHLRAREDRRFWRAVCLFYVAFLALMASGLIRAWLAGRL